MEHSRTACTYQIKFLREIIIGIGACNVDKLRKTDVIVVVGVQVLEGLGHPNDRGLGIEELFEFSLVEYVVLVGIGIPPFAEVAFSFSFLGECRKTTRVVLSGRNNDFFTAILPAPHSGQNGS